MFIKNPLNWWNRFGDSSKPCPKHICSYTPFYRAPNTNYDYLMLQNQMGRNQMGHNNQIPYNKMMPNNQLMHQMPTSSNYNDSPYRPDRRYQREHEQQNTRGRNFNSSRGARDDVDYRRERSDRNNNKSYKNSKRHIDDDYSNSKRTKRFQAH